MANRRTTAGVLVTDGVRLLVGHAAGSPRWDIPKGLVEPGEAPLAAACRELGEETGLAVDPAALRDLGTHAYLPAKDLALFLWRPAVLPDPAGLVCRSTFVRNGRTLQEFDRFALMPWDDAAARVGRNLARVLAAVRAASSW